MKMKVKAKNKLNYEINKFKLTLMIQFIQQMKHRGFIRLTKITQISIVIKRF